MSRVGKKPIPIPKEVKVVLNNEGLMVKGPRGELNRSMPPELSVQVDADKVSIHSSSG
jgi:large subunit ribosomal protein L6